MAPNKKSPFGIDSLGNGRISAISVVNDHASAPVFPEIFIPFADTLPVFVGNIRDNRIDKISLVLLRKRSRKRFESRLQFKFGTKRSNHMKRHRIHAFSNPIISRILFHRPAGRDTLTTTAGCKKQDHRTTGHQRFHKRTHLNI